MINGVRIRQPLCSAGSTRATTKWQEAVQLEKDLVKAALAGKLGAQDAPKTLFAACEKYLQAKQATANTARVVEFDRERLEIVKRYLGDIRLSSITRDTIEGFQAKRRVDGASNRTVNMDVGALRRVLKRFKYWHRLEDDVKMLTESGYALIGGSSHWKNRSGCLCRAAEPGMGASCTARGARARTLNARRRNQTPDKDIDPKRRRCIFARARTRGASECCLSTMTRSQQ
jgi:hypothetical protein